MAMYAIVNRIGKKKLYLCGLEKGYSVDWVTDGYGRILRKVERVPAAEGGRGKGRIVTGNYLPDASKAMLFRRKDSAERKIRENPVLRFCVVEEVSV